MKWLETINRSGSTGSLEQSPQTVTEYLCEKEKKMKKHIGLTALAVLTAFTIGFAPGLAQAKDFGGPVEEGGIIISGTVEKSNPGYVLVTSRGTIRLTGVNASKWVGQKVEVWGDLSKDPTTDRETIAVDRLSSQGGQVEPKVAGHK
jgi:hypothetical protein